MLGTILYLVCGGNYIRAHLSKLGTIHKKE